MTSPEIKNKYQLRKAAGLYWLLNMEQKGMPYQKPIPLNETGAAIWRMLLDGESFEQIAQKLAKEYETSVDEISDDMQQFIKQLESCGIFKNGD